jgi:acetate kinase
MGLTPVEGLVLGTRSGDLDPAIHAHLHRELGWSLADIDHALNHDPGLKGLCGHCDSREVEQLRVKGDAAATLAFDIFCYRIRKYVGAYYAALGWVDAVVFTAGIGERSPETRTAALAGLERLGIAVDDVRNTGSIEGPTVISQDTSDVAMRGGAAGRGVGDRSAGARPPAPTCRRRGSHVLSRRTIVARATASAPLRRAGRAC